MGSFDLTPATMPGDVLLFQCLSNSTIGAVRFHGRVRDGIGGALTLWSPSNEAGAYTWDFNRCFDVSGWLNHPCHNGRSEEHTSELQSLMRISYAVFCLKTKTK